MGGASALAKNSKQMMTNLINAVSGSDVVVQCVTIDYKYHPYCRIVSNIAYNMNIANSLLKKMSPEDTQTRPASGATVYLVNAMLCKTFSPMAVSKNSLTALAQDCYTNRVILNNTSIVDIGHFKGESFGRNGETYKWFPLWNSSGVKYGSPKDTVAIVQDIVAYCPMREVCVGTGGKKASVSAVVGPTRQMDNTAKCESPREETSRIEPPIESAVQQKSTDILSSKQVQEKISPKQEIVGISANNTPPVSSDQTWNFSIFDAISGVIGGAAAVDDSIPLRTDVSPEPVILGKVNADGDTASNARQTIDLHSIDVAPKSKDISKVHSTGIESAADDTDTDKNLQSAYALLCNSSAMKSKENLESLMDELGVLSSSDLIYCESAQLEQLSRCLKPVQSKKFLALCAANPNK